MEGSVKVVVVIILCAFGFAFEYLVRVNQNIVNVVIVGVGAWGLRIDDMTFISNLVIIAGFDVVLYVDKASVNFCVG